MTGPARGLDTVGRPEEGLSDPCPLFAEGLSRANAWKHHLGLRCWLCRADQCRDSALGSEGPPLPAVGEHAWAMGGGQLCAIASVTDWRYRSVCQVHTCCPVLPSLATSPLTPSSLCLQTIFPWLRKWLLAPGLSPPMTGALGPVPLLLQLQAEPGLLPHFVLEELWFWRPWNWAGTTGTAGESL